MWSNIAIIKDIDITVVCWAAFHMLSGWTIRWNCIKLQGHERARHYGPCLLPCLLRVRWERSAVVQHKDGMISEELQDSSSRHESCGNAVKECFSIYSTIASVQ